ncbi:hypothetical protein GGI43DRAFT_340102 [Trichoderma evansii]
MTASHTGASSGRAKQIGCQCKYGLRRLSSPSVLARQHLRRICRVQLQICACMRMIESDHLLECALETARRQRSLCCVRLLTHRALCSVPLSKYCHQHHIPLYFLRKMSCPPYNPSYASSGRHARLSLPLLTASAHLSRQPSFLKEPCKSHCDVDCLDAFFHQLSFAYK